MIHVRLHPSEYPKDHNCKESGNGCNQQRTKGARQSNRARQPHACTRRYSMHLAIGKNDEAGSQKGDPFLIPNPLAPKKAVGVLAGDGLSSVRMNDLSGDIA